MCGGGKVGDKHSVSVSVGWRYILGRRLQLVTLGSQRPARGQLLRNRREEGTTGSKRILKRKIESDRQLSSSQLADICLVYFSCLCYRWGGVRGVLGMSYISAFVPMRKSKVPSPPGST